jgi:hypothetical protein
MRTQMLTCKQIVRLVVLGSLAVTTQITRAQTGPATQPVDSSFWAQRAVETFKTYRSTRRIDQPDIWGFYSQEIDQLAILRDKTNLKTLLAMLEEDLLKPSSDRNFRVMNNGVPQAGQAVIALVVVGEQAEARRLTKSLTDANRGDAIWALESWARLDDWAEVDRIREQFAKPSFPIATPLLIHLAAQQKHLDRAIALLDIVKSREVNYQDVPNLAAECGKMAEAEKAIAALPKTQQWFGWSRAAQGCYLAGDDTGFARAIDQLGRCGTSVNVAEVLLAVGKTQEAKKYLDAHPPEINLDKAEDTDLFAIARVHARAGHVEGAFRFTELAKTTKRSYSSTWIRGESVVAIAKCLYEFGAEREAEELLAKGSFDYKAPDVARAGGVAAHLAKGDLPGALALVETYHVNTTLLTSLVKYYAACGNTKGVKELLGPKFMNPKYEFVAQSDAVAGDAKQLEAQFTELAGNTEARVWFCLGVLKGLNANREIPAALRPVSILPQ